MAGQFVDISQFNPINIDWQVYKAWSAAGDGISRISLRSSYGTGNIDEHFLAYRAAALTAGIDVIIFYHYAYPQYNAAIDEANYQYSVVGAIRPNDVIMLDYEEAVPQATVQWALDFLAQQTKNYNGKLPTIYASSNYVKTRLQDSSLAVYPLTLANWTYDPNARPACPPPWSSYSYLQYSDKAIVPGIPAPVDADVFLGSTPQGGLVKLDSNGCVMTVPKSFQLETGESPDLCGPWSVVAVAHSVPPGESPHTSNEDIDVYTDNMVDKLFGPGGFDHIKFLGVLPKDMITIMNYVRDDTGLIHYQVVPATLDNMYRALDAGYPVLFSCNEANITAWDKNNQQWVHAYPWLVSAGHVLPAGGYEKGTKNIISPDQLNDAYQEYWPIIYRASDLGKSLSWMAIIQVIGPDKNNPYLASIPGSNPATWPAGFNAQLAGGGLPMPLPTGAKDDGTTIHFANSSLILVRGFRNLYNTLAAAGRVPPDDAPLVNEYGCHPVEQSNAAFWATTDQAKGTAQETRYFRLGYSPKQGAKVTYIGQELRWYVDNYNAAQAQIAALKAQVATLEAAITTATGGTIPQAVLDDIAHLAGLIPPAAAALETLVHDAGITLPPPTP